MRQLQIKKIISELEMMPSLKPSPKVNRLFSSLVRISLMPYPFPESISQETKKEVQNICSKGEYQLELYWAKKIITSTNPLSTLKSFPYFKNYQDLTRMEWGSLLSCRDHDNHKILFVGGGPLPLTAILLGMFYGQEVTILDISKEAVQISKEIISKLGLSKKIKVINQSGHRFSGYQRFNTVFLAALAGADSEEKDQILRQIKNYCPKNSHILVRSSYGNRELLYKPVDTFDFPYLKPIIEVRPHNHIVNSIIIFSRQ